MAFIIIAMKKTKLDARALDEKWAAVKGLNEEAGAEALYLGRRRGAVGPDARFQRISCSPVLRVGDRCKGCIATGSRASRAQPCTTSRRLKHVGHG